MNKYKKILKKLCPPLLWDFLKRLKNKTNGKYYGQNQLDEKIETFVNFDNGFFVELGTMIVRVWQTADQEGLVDETVLQAGDFTQVKPGLVHQFEGVEDGVAFELYWAEFSHDDIERRTVGTTANNERRIKDRRILKG